MKSKVIAIGGPTASGKSGLAKEIVSQYLAQAISVDSAQIYKGLDLGTGKDKSFSQRMLDICEPGADFSVFQFTQLALDQIKQVQKLNQIPVLVGGSGYYLDALLYDKQFPDIRNPELVAKLDALPTQELIYRLERQDPASAKRTDKNRRRVLRALEIVETTHQPVPKQEIVDRFNTLLIVIDPGKDELAKNIEIRLEERLKEGLVNEVRQLKKTVDKNWLETKAGLEYTYISGYLDNRFSYNSCMEHIISDSLAYANRQRTWFRRYKQAIWVKTKDEGLSLVADFLSDTK